MLNVSIKKAVLILVVMEYTQWADCQKIYITCCTSLNPCCNGIYSMRSWSFAPNWSDFCLNPCCNGIYSMRGAKLAGVELSKVLILVVMEYTQWGEGI